VCDIENLRLATGDWLPAAGCCCWQLAIGGWFSNLAKEDKTSPRLTMNRNNINFEKKYGIKLGKNNITIYQIIK
jgi:hypothetical protein